MIMSDDDALNEQELWFGPSDKPFRFHGETDAHPLYDHCGCLYPCPDHQSPKQDKQRDEDYWNDHYDTE